jgi:hypothetical protein
VVEEGTAGLVLLSDEGVECGFAGGRTLELQKEMIHDEIGADFAAIVEGVGFAADVAGEGDHLRIVDWGGDEGLSSWGDLCRS